MAATATVTPTPTGTTDTQRVHLGVSAGGQNIEAFRFGQGPNVVVFVGGIHAGFAPSGVRLAQQAVEFYRNNPGAVPEDVSIFIVENMNPDSPNAPGDLEGRLNANGVDLNRNWPCAWERDPEAEGQTVPGGGGTEPLSEPEVQALADFFETQQPRAVVFWGARYYYGLVVPGGCEEYSAVSQPLTELYAGSARYHWFTPRDYTGDMVAGDVTNWLDSEGVPAIFVFLRSQTDTDWDRNLAAIEAVVSFYAGGRD